MSIKRSTISHSSLMGLLGLVLVLFPVRVGAQSQSLDLFSGGESQGVAFHRFIQSGEIPIQIKVLGHVRSPGLYEVSLETDLARILALAGGNSGGLPSSGERLNLRVDLYRSAAQRQSLVYTIPLDSLFIAGQPYPKLQDGDVVNIDGTIERKFSWRDTLSIATSAAALALFVDRLIRIIG